MVYTHKHTNTQSLDSHSLHSRAACQQKRGENNEEGRGEERRGSGFGGRERPVTSSRRAGSEGARGQGGREDTKARKTLELGA